MGLLQPTRLVTDGPVSHAAAPTIIIIMLLLGAAELGPTGRVLTESGSGIPAECLGPCARQKGTRTAH